MSITELLNAIGSDSITFQNLDECSISMNYDHKKGTVIKFGTDQKLTFESTKELGLIVWLDREKVKAAIESVSVPKTSTETNDHMTDQSIEDAIRREFEKTFSHMELDKVKDAWGKERYKHEHIESIWYGWQAARQSSQSEPVAIEALKERDRLGHTVVQVIGTLDEIIEQVEEITLHDANYFAVPAELWHELEDALEKMPERAESFLAAPQQAIPSGRIETLEKAINYLLANDLLSNSHARAVANTALLSASPTAPIERDK
jgi:hypothetical protein